MFHGPPGNIERSNRLLAIPLLVKALQCVCKDLHADSTSYTTRARIINVTEGIFKNKRHCLQKKELFTKKVIAKIVPSISFFFISSEQQ